MVIHSKTKCFPFSPICTLPLNVILTRKTIFKLELSKIASKNETIYKPGRMISVQSHGIFLIKALKILNVQTQLTPGLLKALASFDQSNLPVHNSIKTHDSSLTRGSQV